MYDTENTYITTETTRVLKCFQLVVYLYLIVHYSNQGIVFIYNGWSVEIYPILWDQMSEIGNTDYNDFKFDLFMF